jgi:hypothetical protein
MCPACHFSQQAEYAICKVCLLNQIVVANSIRRQTVVRNKPDHAKTIRAAAEEKRKTKSTER